MIAEIRRAEVSKHDARIPVTVGDGPNALVAQSGSDSTVKRC